MSTEARIAALEKLAAQTAAKRARRRPYSEVCVHSIIRNEASVVYHPQGNYGGTEKTNGLTIAEAARDAKQNGAAVFVRMVFSPEWRHCLSQACDAYTDEQKARLKENDCARWPEEIMWIYAQDCPEKIISAISQIPQTFRLKG